jgi:hypothetical protein
MEKVSLVSPSFLECAPFEALPGMALNGFLTGTADKINSTTRSDTMEIALESTRVSIHLVHLGNWSSGCGSWFRDRLDVWHLIATG